jgi:hypothetical protein
MSHGILVDELKFSIDMNYRSATRAHVAGLLHNLVAGARVGACGAYLGDHEQAHSCAFPHDELA